MGQIVRTPAAGLASLTGDLASDTGHQRAINQRYAGLSKRELIEFYRLIYLSRRMDDKEISLKRQNKMYFQISGAGHEIPGVCAGRLMRAGYDWFFPYYRDRALALALGVTPKEMMLSAVGSWDDPSSGGRQMPSHWSSDALHIVSTSSPTGTQFLQATGCSQARSLFQAINELSDLESNFQRDEVVFVSTGEGTTSQGEFWEAINTAAINRLPLFILVEDNGYAISAPVEVQTAGGSISKAFKGLPGLAVYEADGCDFLETYTLMQEAVEHARAGRGPVLFHAHVVRPYNHSMSDNAAQYRVPEDLKADEERDPIKTFGAFLIQEGILTLTALERLHTEVTVEVDEAADAVADATPPPPHSIEWYVYSPDVDPTSSDFATEPQLSGTDGTMVDLLNDCMRTEMRRDPLMLVFGEDVADVSREEYLDRVKGKGGVFKVTHGLQREFGGERVFNTPLAEAAIIGRAYGLAVRGFKPVVEIQFFDYIWPAYHQLRNEVSNLRWRSNNAFKCPMVIRVPIGGYLKGGAPYHSQSGEVLFTHIPGLRVVMPSNALDANGLLRTAIRSDDPVLFLEPKHLYRQTYNKSQNPGPDYMIPFGKAKCVRAGEDVTIVTYGNLVQRSMKAAAILADEGIEVEILDLRSLSPYDWDAIAESVKRTNKVIVAHEDCQSWGFGGEIAARIADELFEFLDGPVRRIGSMDTFVAYHPGLEDNILPQIDDIAHAARRLAHY